MSTILITGTGFTLPAYAAGQKSWVFKGTCSKGNIAESDGVQTGAASGMMGTKDYFALMQRAKAAHLTVGSDGPSQSRSAAVSSVGPRASCGQQNHSTAIQLPSCKWTTTRDIGW